MTVLRDRRYLDWLRTQRCLICGVTPSDPAHIGTSGTGIKSPDNHVIPLCHRHHAESHSVGIGMLMRMEAPALIMSLALKALAEKMHAEWQMKS